MSRCDKSNSPCGWVTRPSSLQREYRAGGRMYAHTLPAGLPHPWGATSWHPQGSCINFLACKCARHDTPDVLGIEPQCCAFAGVCLLRGAHG